MESKADTLVSLIQQGQRTLSFLNAREVAFAALVVRRQKAVVLVARKKEALIFLARQPLGLWANLDKIEATQRWLAERGTQALAHLQKRAKAFQLLQVRRMHVGLVVSHTCLILQCLLLALMRSSPLARPPLLCESKTWPLPTYSSSARMRKYLVLLCNVALYRSTPSGYAKRKRVCSRRTLR